MTTTAGHSFYIGPISSFYNQVNDTGSWEPLVKVSSFLDIKISDHKLCDKVCQWPIAGQWFSLGTPVSSTNKTDHHDITVLLLKVALNSITSSS